MTLYMVWDGSYSDATVLGIYSTMEKALEAKEQFNADQDIEERELDEMPDHPPGLVAWSVNMKKDGSLWTGKYNNPNPSRAGAISPRSLCYYPNYEWTEPMSFPRKTAYVHFYVWAKDIEHAIKVANERRAQLIATNEWTDDYSAWTRRIQENAKSNKEQS